MEIPALFLTLPNEDFMWVVDLEYINPENFMTKRLFENGKYQDFLNLTDKEFLTSNDIEEIIYKFKITYGQFVVLKNYLSNRKLFIIKKEKYNYKPIFSIETFSNNYKRDGKNIMVNSEDIIRCYEIYMKEVELTKIIVSNIETLNNFIYNPFSQDFGEEDNKFHRSEELMNKPTLNQESFQDNKTNQFSQNIKEICKRPEKIDLSHLGIYDRGDY